MATDSTQRVLAEVLAQLHTEARQQSQKLDDLVRCANRITQAVACAESRQDAWTADFLDVERHRQGTEAMSPRW